MLIIGLSGVRAILTLFFSLFSGVCLFPTRTLKRVLKKSSILKLGNNFFIFHLGVIKVVEQHLLGGQYFVGTNIFEGSTNFGTHLFGGSNSLNQILGQQFWGVKTLWEIFFTHFWGS